MRYLLGGLPLVFEVDADDEYSEEQIERMNLIESRFPRIVRKSVVLPWSDQEIEYWDLGARLSDLFDAELEEYIEFREECHPEPFRIRCQHDVRWSKYMRDCREMNSGRLDPVIPGREDDSFGVQDAIRELRHFKP